MKLHDLKPNVGKTKNRKRLGRGPGSTDGKTSGRGTKGQGARSGGGTRLYHQGGNLPFFRRLPFKRGFTNINRIEFNEMNLDQLNSFRKGSNVTPEVLLEKGMLKNPNLPIVILARGKLEKALNISAHRVSKGALAQIEEAGGTFTQLEFKK